jgi:hypothetical protein
VCNLSFSVPPFFFFFLDMHGLIFETSI